MSIVILKAGICDTIQDVGRNGYGASGINPSGAMDVFALQVANALAANPLEPWLVLEMQSYAKAV